MKYQIPTIEDEDLDLAVSAEIGAESRLFVSYDPVHYAGQVEQEGADLGTLVKDKTFKAPEDEGSGRDMQVICDGPVLSADEVVLTFNVTFAGALPAAKTISGNSAANPTVVTTSAAHGLTSGNEVVISGSNSTPTLNGTHTVTVISSTTFSVAVNVSVAGTAGSVQGPVGAPTTGTAVATFTPPATSQDASFNFPTGLGVDLVPSTDGATIRTIDSIASVAGGKAGNKFMVVALPNRDSYSEVMCATDKSVPVPVGKSIAIACRYNGSRWIKRGVSEVPDAEFKAKYGSYADGLPRLNGHRITAMLETHKDDRILTERIVLGGWRPTVNINKGNGDAEAEASAKGMYELFAAFV